MRCPYSDRSPSSPWLYVALRIQTWLTKLYLIRPLSTFPSSHPPTLLSAHPTLPTLIFLAVLWTHQAFPHLRVLALAGALFPIYSEASFPHFLQVSERPLLRKPFVSAWVLVGNRRHMTFRKTKGLITEVCAGWRKPMARPHAMLRLEGAKGRNSVVEVHRELQPWRPLGLSEGAVLTEGGNQGQSRTLSNKHTDFTFCVLAKHSWKPESKGVRAM